MEYDKIKFYSNAFDFSTKVYGKNHTFTILFSEIKTKYNIFEKGENTLKIIYMKDDCNISLCVKNSKEMCDIIRNNYNKWNGFKECDPEHEFQSISKYWCITYAKPNFITLCTFFKGDKTEIFKYIISDGYYIINCDEVEEIEDFIEI